MRLIIVESPTKSKTISKFLGPKYQVLSSYGHVRDLPKGEFGIDVENNFEPKYVIPPKARKVIKLLKEAVAKADTTILATDEDREGEAISWHLSQILSLNGKKPYQRIVFHEITKPAIEKALKNPRKIDMDLVDAQQARRFLDRIVGYKLSPFLWKKVARKLSAGRVQSVAVRLVVEREREINSFTPREYWSIEALLKKQKNDFLALLIKKGNKVIPKLGIKNKKEAEEIVKDLESAEVDEADASSSHCARLRRACIYKVINIEKKELKRNPLPPFTTSTLQQEAWKRFRFPAKFTMQIAQKLYENGLTTYHRTDSLNLSDLSLSAAKKFIIKDYGKKYWSGYFRKYKTKSKGAQEAHEAIRPAYPEKTPDSLKLSEEDKSSSLAFADRVPQSGTKVEMKFISSAAARLYDLIWRRFIACQMNQAVFDATCVDIAAKNYTFRVNGQILKFDGFLKIYPIKFEENALPSLEKNETLELVKLIPSQHFTQPPPRFTEATLIKQLEENGIGRPSTYAPTLSTVQARNYIEKDEQKRFKPTEIGYVVNDVLVSHFPQIVDVGFTAAMEEDLDEIAQGKEKTIDVLRKFYIPFEENLKKKYEEVSKKEISAKPTDKICPKCGAPLLIRFGRFGEFYACSKFPNCRYTEALEKNNLGIKCPKCEKGQIVEKRTKKGKIFYGCDQYPKCDFALWDKPTGELCPKCKSLLVQTKRNLIKCSDKECDFKVEK